MNEIDILQERIQKLEDTLSMLVRSDRYTFLKDIEMDNGRNIQLSKNYGTKIGTASTQKLAFWGDTPVTQPAAIADVASGAGDSDGTARAKINALLAALRTTGIIDT